MKTTIEFPDSLVREAKMIAARDGTTLRALATRGLQGEVRRRSTSEGIPPPWLRSFGGLSELHDDTLRLNAAVQEAFETVDEDAWK